MSHIHVIGAGLAGLSAAITATGIGHEVTLYEATGAGGGRCRSYFDTELGIRLDNGNHLLLSGNEAALGYIHEIGARDRLAGPGRPIFPFMDLTTGRKWTLRPSPGRIPWWLLFPNRRVPKTTVREYLPLRAIGRERDGTVMTETIPHRALYRSLLEPLSIAALNTRPHEALACLFGAVLRETLLKGGKACLPLLPKEGLSELLVEPAIETLRKRGAGILFSRRISGVVTGHGRATALETNEGKVVLGADDAVVLAVPPWIAAELLPGMTVPNAFESILNVHFKLTIDPREAGLGDVAEAGFIGLVNGTAEWVFIRRDHVSVTVSAANELIDRRADDLAIGIWGDVARALNLDTKEVPPFRVIKERRATIVANATQEARRPGARTDIENLVLAGDWTDTRLPGTIEGAIRSGVTALQAIFNMPGMVSKGPMRSLASHDA
jgi:squalene-associated FAD-dependent desaturase